MKITKNFISLFFVTFIIGYYSVLPIKKENPELLKLSDLNTIAETNSEMISTNLTEKTTELETIKEITDADRDDFSRYRIKLLETGKGFHGDEVEAKSGETWQGLFKENDVYVLRPAKIKIRRVYDDIVDYKKKERTGKDVLVDGKNQPLFLLKNAHEAKAGKVTTLYQGLTWKDAFEKGDSEMPFEDMLTTLKKGFSKQFEIGGKKYELKVIEAKNTGNEKLYALTLESGEVKQVIHTMKADENFNIGHLYWVGDLDRDGKPDFYFDLFRHYNLMYRVLYVSSFAHDDELVSIAAYFLTSGC